MRQIFMPLFVTALWGHLYWPKAETPPPTLEQRAQAIVDHKLGQGVAWVSVRVETGQGKRRLERKRLGQQGFVVSSKSSQERHQKSGYSQDVRTETLNLPESREFTDQENWTERICVVVITERESTDLANLLEVGLGLDKERGDQIAVSPSIKRN